MLFLSFNLVYRFNVPPPGYLCFSWVGVAFKRLNLSRHNHRPLPMPRRQTNAQAAGAPYGCTRPHCRRGSNTLPAPDGARQRTKGAPGGNGAASAAAARDGAFKPGSTRPERFASITERACPSTRRSNVCGYRFRSRGRATNKQCGVRTRQM